MSKRFATAVVAAVLAAGMSLPATGLASGGGHHTTGNHFGFQHGTGGLHRGSGKACPTPKKPKKDKGKSKGANHGRGKKCGIKS
jgi:hypothetical protein